MGIVVFGNYGVDMADYGIEIKGLDEVIAKLGKLSNRSVVQRMNKEIGFACAELTGDHIASKVSPNYHKTADRLGAVHTGFFEFARGRQGRYDGKEGRYIDSKEATESGVKVVIGNTPGISRAFHDLNIKPKRANYLTIPIHKDSYGKTVKVLKQVKADLSLFRIKTKRGGLLLMGTEGKGSSRVTRPLYVLVKSSHIPQDRKLLPTNEEYIEKARETAEAFVEVEML